MVDDVLWGVGPLELIASLVRVGVCQFIKQIAAKGDDALFQVEEVLFGGFGDEFRGLGGAVDEWEEGGEEADGCGDVIEFAIVVVVGEGAGDLFLKLEEVVVEFLFFVGAVGGVDDEFLDEEKAEFFEFMGFWFVVDVFLDEFQIFIEACGPVIVVITVGVELASDLVEGGFVCCGFFGGE